jgi:hypothetical protein
MGPVLCAAGVALMLALVIWAAILQGDECREAGGHIGPRSICLTDDGRVLEFGRDR